jgi:hypothetical protein
LDSGKHGQLISEGWCADYPDPENFADVLFHTGNAMNQGNYSNPDLDTILEEARVEKDPVKRIEMYQQAEKIIINDSPVIFLKHSNSYVLVKPYLQGFVGTPIDVPLERYLWIDAEKLRNSLINLRFEWNMTGRMLAFVPFFLQERISPRELIQPGSPLNGNFINRVKSGISPFSRR